MTVSLNKPQKTIEDRQCTFYVTTKCVRATIVAVEKQTNIAYFEYVFVALDIQHSMCMRHIFICHYVSVAVSCAHDTATDT